jgi:hypothetical protein
MTPQISPAVLALTTVAAISACAIVVTTLIGTWPILITAALLLVASLTALWKIQHRRDHTLW